MCTKYGEFFHSNMWNFYFFCVFFPGVFGSRVNTVGKSKELDTYVKQIKSPVKEISDKNLPLILVNLAIQLYSKSENANDFFLLHGEDICEFVKLFANINIDIVFSLATN